MTFYFSGSRTTKILCIFATLLFRFGYWGCYDNQRREDVKRQPPVPFMGWRGFKKEVLWIIQKRANQNFESYGGIAPVPTDKNLGFAIRIDIVDYKDSGVISEKPYAVRIIYGPFDFMKEKF